MFLMRNSRKDIVQSCIRERSDRSHTKIAEHGRVELVDGILVDTKLANFGRVISSKIPTTMELSKG